MKLNVYNIFGLTSALISIVEIISYANTHSHKALTAAVILCIIAIALVMKGRNYVPKRDDKLNRY